jgi:hypothetical protein
MNRRSQSLDEAKHQAPDHVKLMIIHQRIPKMLKATTILLSQLLKRNDVALLLAA